ncbi:MAG: anti-sigma factor [Holophagaceae bacterium]
MSLQDSNLRPVTLTAALIVMVGAQYGCQRMASWRTKPQEMHGASDIPAGQGTVKVTSGDNGNSNVSIRVKHLAPPSKIAADSTVYVVWFRPVDGDSQNVGALILNSDLEGSLDTLTPHRRFRITVTPEPNGQAASPTNEPVFTYHVESNK